MICLDGWLGFGVTAILFCFSWDLNAGLSSLHQRSLSMNSSHHTCNCVAPVRKFRLIPSREILGGLNIVIRHCVFLSPKYFKRSISRSIAADYWYKCIVTIEYKKRYSNASQSMNIGLNEVIIFQSY